MQAQGRSLRAISEQITITNGPVSLRLGVNAEIEIQHAVVTAQVAGLGHSPMSRRYAIRSLDEAEAYIAHALLGPRLIECTDLVNAVEGRSAHAIFGSPDDMKFQSSMTLFAVVAPNEPAFRLALERYFGGAEDRRTTDLLISRRS